MFDFEIVKQTFLPDLHVRFIDEFQPGILIAFVENAGYATIIDMRSKQISDFAINKYDKMVMFGIIKLQKCPHHYLVKHKGGIKIVNPVLKRWYDLCFDN